MYDIMANCQDLKQDSSQRAADLQGNPTERALLQFVETQELPLQQVAAKFLLALLTSTWQLCILCKRINQSYM